MQELDNYICKIATTDEIIEKWDYEIAIHDNDPNYIKTKNSFIEENNKGTRITYVGKLNDKIICDCSAVIKEEGIKQEALINKDLVSNKRCYVFAFRTNKGYENKGYFSTLYKFMENDLINRGFTEFSLFVEPQEIRNILIYFKWGYTNYVRLENKIDVYGNDHTFLLYYKKI